MSRPLLVDSSASGALEIAVQGDFRFWRTGRDELLELPGGSQRLLAFLALRECPVPRTAAATTLWPDVSDEHAQASLRSAINRLSQVAHEAIIVDHRSLCLAEDVGVDIRASRALAHRLLDPGEPRQEADSSEAAIAALAADLLPDWYDDWTLVESEDWRQLRLHALDALCVQLTACGRYGDAISAALAAVNAEPLRETSHANLIRVHLAEGNRSEARRAFERYRQLLRAELELEPGPRIRALLRDL
jgi:SARP family transcriptional regulator, regulator of embCAB operon